MKPECQQCKKEIQPTEYPGGRVDHPARHARRKFCDNVCSAKYTEDPNALPDQFRRKAHRHIGESCEECGISGWLNVHHIDLNPRNNQRANLITLCMKCHRKKHHPKYVLREVPE